MASSSAPLRVFASATLVAGSTLVLAPTAQARPDDCPPGSLFRSQDSYSWCEPTVCQTDAQCNPEEVCRPVPLCLQVGTLKQTTAALGDAGTRLVATQQCGPDSSCPQTTVCSAQSRCLTKTVADRMGLLSVTSPSPSASTGAGAGTGAKKSCGCDVVGRPQSARGGAAAFALAFGLFLARGRRRVAPRRAAPRRIG